MRIPKVKAGIPLAAQRGSASIVVPSRASAARRPCALARWNSGSGASRTLNCRNVRVPPSRGAPQHYVQRRAGATDRDKGTVATFKKIENNAIVV